MIVSDLGPVGSGSSSPEQAGVPRVPSFVALHLTKVCSHHCPICYYSEDAGPPPTHPPVDRILRVLDALADAGVAQICFLGGDPAKYPGVLQVARRVKERGIELSILSNTLSFPGRRDDLAARYFDALETTIHGPTADEHDAFCGRKGAYSSVVRQLQYFSSMGRRTGIALNVIPTTARRVFEVVSPLVGSHGIALDYVIVQRIIPFGRAASSSAFTLGREHVESALEGIDRVSAELGIDIFVEDPFPLCIMHRNYWRYMRPCQWGYTRAAVDSFGNVSRCGADPRYRLGNVLETPLSGIWSDSPILASFRGKQYLPGRCRVCEDLERCGGGCPLSCEIEKDHGVDYLYSVYEQLDHEVHGTLRFDHARREELSSILQIEWNNFPGYSHLFSVESIQACYDRNPRMFYVVRDARGWVLAYAAIVPVTQPLFEQIRRGLYSSLAQFPMDGVLPECKGVFWHIEVVAAVPSRSASRVGGVLVHGIGRYLLDHAKYMTASPITPVGVRLCEHFGFRRVGYEQAEGGPFPIYYREVESRDLSRILQKF